VIENAECSSPAPRGNTLRRGPFARCWSSPVRRQLLPTAPMTDRRAWPHHAHPRPVPTAYALSHAVTGMIFRTSSPLPAGREGSDNHVDKSGILGEDARARLPTTSAPSRSAGDGPGLRETGRGPEPRSGPLQGIQGRARNQQANVRNDMYVASEAIRLMEKPGNPHSQPLKRR